MDSRPERSPFAAFVIRYGTALLLVAAALGMTMLIWIFVKSLASPLFLVAILIVAWKDGLRPGILATLLSGICIDYFFIIPEYQLSGALDDVMRLSVFVAEGGFLCWLVTSRTNASKEISESREQLRALSLRQQLLREDERKRIALEIHDELGQNLTGLKMEMHLLNKKVRREGEIIDTDKISHEMDDLMSLVDHTILNVRRIATELRPPILDDLGVVAAIEWQTHEFQRRTGITCVLSMNVESIDVGAESATAVFRIFQESLTNITRHAEANTINVILNKLGNKLILRIEDDGIGIQFDNIDSNNSLGLLGMHERARLIGGELQIFNGDENGTVVLLTASMA